MKVLRRLVKKEQGFTLLELLMVILIIGVLVLVSAVTLNVSSFSGSGTSGASKTEMNSVQAALMACTIICSVNEVNAGSDVTGDISDLELVNGMGDKGKLGHYLLNQLHGVYSWDTNGVITAATYSGWGVTCNYTVGSGRTCSSG